MWLLENSGGALQGRRLWLRPGKRYLFGRTRAEPGQLVVSDKTISRKHLTIDVDRVREGGGRDCSARSVVTIEDLNTKIGTVVNGTQIRGQKFVLIQDRNEVKMGHMADLFRITWFPVVFSFSFTSKELRADPWARLRDDLEQLDVKYLADYDLARTTHVVAKKRNTSKGLQALINGKHIVAESFITALVQAATGGTNGAVAAAVAPLEENFDASWPNALSHLPPRGDEPSDRPVSTYGPDARRRDVFDGYTFVFYDEKQYENLLGPISNARGKALLGKVVPGVTEVDDFVRYIKGVAGETGLGEFEDGSVGKGVVVVRYLPAKGDHVDWFARFTTAVALRLDHRLIDQREFLDAILAVDPSMLRRPLEVEQYRPPPPDAMVVDETTVTGPAVEAATSQPVAAPPSLSQASSIRRARARRGITSRFKGFDEDLDVGDDSGLFSTAAIASEAAVPAPAVPASDNEDDKMFVSQTRDEEGPEPYQRNPRKRGTPAPAEDRNGDVMDDIAPTAAAVKRQRIEAGVDPVPLRGVLPDSDEENEDSELEDDGQENKRGSKASERASGLKRGKGKDASDTILDQARKNREAAEKRAAEERAELEQVPDDGVDADVIRKLTLVEEIAVVRRPRGPEAAAAAAGARRELDRAGGRWDPKWNGRRNFKRFRKQGDPVGRPAPRVIVRLEPAKTKEYGLGDDYWLEGVEDAQRQRRDGASALNNSNASSSIRVPPTVDPTPSTSTAGRSSGVRAGYAVSNAHAARSGRVGEDANLSDAEVVLDTEPEDNSGGGGDISVGQSDSARHAATRDSSPPSAIPGRIPETGQQPEPEPNLPRTRAGKAATRAAVARQSQASQASQVRAQRTRSGAPATRGNDTQEADTQASSDAVFHTPLSSAAVAPAASAAAGKRAAPATAASRAPPPKRPRRVGGLGGSSMGSTPGTITLRNSSDDDDDDDDGLKFKFRSRR